MKALRKEKEVIGKGGKPKIIRRQHCINCDTVLALEITDKLGFGGDYWWIKDGIWIAGRWFGNQIKCPVCGLEGKLPMDKPLSYESIVNKEQKENKPDGK